MVNPTHLGLDTHKDTIAVAVLRPGESEPDRCAIPNSPEAIRKLIARLGGRRSWSPATSPARPVTTPIESSTISASAAT
jgi:hypothetical protein